MKKIQRLIKKSPLGYITGNFRSNHLPDDVANTIEEILEKKRESHHKESFMAVLKTDKGIITTIHFPYTEKNLNDNNMSQIFPKDPHKKDITLLFHDSALEIVLIFDTKTDLPIGTFYAHQNDWNIKAICKRNKK